MFTDTADANINADADGNINTDANADFNANAAGRDVG